MEGAAGDSFLLQAPQEGLRQGSLEDSGPMPHVGADPNMAALGSFWVGEQREERDEAGRTVCDVAGGRRNGFVGVRRLWKTPASTPLGRNILWVWEGLLK